MGCAGAVTCRRQEAVYCIGIRYARADAGVALGSPFDELPPGSEIDYVDVLSAPYFFVSEKGKTTVSHREHQFYDEPVREVREGSATYFAGDEGEKHPVVWQRIGDEERLRYGFAGRRCLMWDLPKGCDSETAEYMVADMRCGHSWDWLHDQPKPHRPNSRIR
jgi:hypothetical protein